jgi:hypothetical protein
MYSAEYLSSGIRGSSTILHLSYILQTWPSKPNIRSLATVCLLSLIFHTIKFQLTNWSIARSGTNHRILDRLFYPVKLICWLKRPKENLWLTWMFEENFRTNILLLLLLLCSIFMKGRKYVFCLGHPTCGFWVKQTLYRSGQTLRVPGVWDFQISRHSAYEGGVIVSPKHRSPLPPRKYSWYSFLLEAESTPGP